LLLGIVGLPIFAQGSSGMEVITGKTGGYLIGFLIASLFMGEFNHRQWPLKIGTSLMAMCIGTAIILLSGFTKLGLDIGWVSAFEHGIKPFLGGAFLKIIIGAYLSMVSYRFIIGRAPTT
jgi:biotin transport system substrate-specific component